MSTADDTSFHAALVQMRTGRDETANLTTATTLIREAAAAGADYVQTPEVTTLMERERQRLFANTRPEANNAALAHFSELAKDLKIWLHIGSIGVLVDERTLANRTYLFQPDGAIAARYDKIHMFDVVLANGEAYRESKRFQPGKEAIVAELPWARLGISICYDLRFPHLYRRLAHAGADILSAPSAFTKTTGEAHWNDLLRARAIETGCYMLAAAQGGLHENQRETYGHSLIVSPWGEVLAEAGIDPCVVSAIIDTSEVAAARERIPSLVNGRDYSVSSVGPDDTLEQAPQE